MNQLSVMIGDKPTGLASFVAVAQPRGVYCLNARVRGQYPQLMSVFRVQNKVDGKKGGWGRLPDACGVADYWRVTDPIASARYELTEKTTYVPKVGHLNLLRYWQLSRESWYAPVNEPIIVRGPDAAACALWWSNWFIEAITIARADGLRLCLGSFATGEPDLAVLPMLSPAFELLKQTGGIIDLHEYGVNGRLMEQGGRSGALGYRAFYNALPPAARCDIVISEFWGHSGFTDAGDWREQVDDAIAYGRQLARDPYVLWASAFQLDQGKESHLVTRALDYYAQQAAQLNAVPAPDRYTVTAGPMSANQATQLQAWCAERQIACTVGAA